MVSVPANPVRVSLEWYDGLEADPDDEDMPGTRGGWFLCITGGPAPNGFIGPRPEYPPDGWETPGQAVDYLTKWASDRGLELFDSHLWLHGRRLDGRS